MAVGLSYLVWGCFYVAIVNECNELDSNLSIVKKRISELDDKLA